MRVPALEYFEWQKGVIAIQDSPPESPSRGDSYIVGTGTGAWEGQDNKIAIYDVSGWIFIAPVKGMFCFVKDVNKLYYYVTSWGEFSSGDERLYPIKIASAGNTLIISSNSETSTGSATYVKAKEIKIRSGGTLRIKFDIKSGTNGRSVYGRIYRNGVAVGTEQTTTSTSYVTFSEDISGWSIDDLVQLYIKRGDLAEVRCQNFRIYVVDPGNHYVTQSSV